MKLPLLGGAYETRSVIASAQRCVNVFPETNPKDALFPTTHYQRPGFKPLVTANGNANPVRSLYRASNGNGYCVIGTKVYSISANWVLTNIGNLLTPGMGPVNMGDNGITIMLVDGSSNGYEIDLATNDFSAIADEVFTGATAVDNIDTFMLWNFPGTKNFGSTLSNQITPLDPTYIASKTNYPDPLMRLIVNRHEILLIGALKTEIWYDAGGEQFPFAELPGVYVEHGTCAPFSVASSDISVFWLCQDLQGIGYVVRQRGYETKVISNYALSVAIRKMAKTGIISDAIGYTYTQDGHSFYVLTFPSGDQTWVFDDSIGEPMYSWHQRAWTDAQGILHRDRSNCHAFINGVNVVGDWQNGTLYALDLDTYTDTVAGVVYDCSYIRSFIQVGTAAPTPRDPVNVMASDGKRINFQKFIADMEVGEGPGDGVINGQIQPNKIALRWSDNRGKTWGEALIQSAGAPGEYSTQPIWQPLGIGRYRVFELSWSFGPAALNGAYLDSSVNNT